MKKEKLFLIVYYQWWMDSGYFSNLYFRGTKKEAYNKARELKEKHEDSFNHFDYDIIPIKEK